MKFINTCFCEQSRKNHFHISQLQNDPTKAPGTLNTSSMRMQPCSIYRYEIQIVDTSTLLKNIDIAIDIDKDNLENIDIDKTILENIDIDIDKDNLGNIVIDIDIDRDYLENINIDIDIDKNILENIDICKAILG